MGDLYVLYCIQLNRSDAEFYESSTIKILSTIIEVFGGDEKDPTTAGISEPITVTDLNDFLGVS